MTALVCADTTCERPGIRTREGQRWCMYHPTEQPPVFDAKGKPVNAITGKPTTVTSVSTTRVGGGVHTYRQPTEVPKHLRPEPAPAFRTLGEELAELERTDPLVRQAAERLDEIADRARRDRLETPPEVAAIEAGDLLALPDRMPSRTELDPVAQVLVPARVAHLGQQMDELLREAEVRAALPAVPDDPTRLAARIAQDLDAYCTAHDIPNPRQVVHVPPPHVEATITALEDTLERLLDEVATVRASVREVRIAYATPAPQPEPAAKPARKRREISPEGRERMRESGRRLGELNRQRAAERKQAQS